MGQDTHPELSGIWDEARSYIGKGEFNKAIETCKYILIMYGDDQAVRERANAWLGDAYLLQQQPGLAEDHIRAAIELNPEKAAYRYMLGYIYSKQCRWEDAVRELRKAVHQEPGHDEFNRGLGWAVYNSGDTLTGISILHTAHELNPDNTTVLTDLAVAYSNLAEFRRARYFIRKALNLDPQNPLIMGANWSIDYMQHLCHLEEDD